MPVQASVSVTATGIQVSPEPIDLTGQGRGAVVIQWDISTAGWSFTSAGIGISNPNFGDGGAAPGNRQRFTWTRRANAADGSTVKYSISVTDGTNPPQVLDPNIINQP